MEYDAKLFIAYTIQLQHNEIVYYGDVRIPFCATSISQRTIIEPAQLQTSSFSSKKKLAWEMRVMYEGSSIKLNLSFPKTST